MSRKFSRRERLSMMVSSDVAELLPVVTGEGDKVLAEAITQLCIRMSPKKLLRLCNNLGDQGALQLLYLLSSETRYTDHTFSIEKVNERDFLLYRNGICFKKIDPPFYSKEFTSVN